MVIFLRDTIVLFDLFLEKRNNENWYWFNKISSSTYHFTRRNDLTVYTHVYLKVIWRQRKTYNIVTMTCRLISIKITILPFHNNQRRVHHICINYGLIDVFALFFVCYIIYKNHYNPVIVRTNNYIILEMIYSTIYWLIKYIFNCLIPKKI